MKIQDALGHRTSAPVCDDDAEAIEILPMYEPDGPFRLELWQGERAVFFSRRIGDV